MKHRITISIDENTILKIRDSLRSRKFRNKSHLAELAIEKLLEEDKKF